MWVCFSPQTAALTTQHHVQGPVTIPKGLCQYTHFHSDLACVQPSDHIVSCLLAAGRFSSAVSAASNRLNQFLKRPPIAPFPVSPDSVPLYSVLTAPHFVLQASPCNVSFQLSPPVCADSLPLQCVSTAPVCLGRLPFSQDNMQSRQQNTHFVDLLYCRAVFPLKNPRVLFFFCYVSHPRAQGGVACSTGPKNSH